MDAVELFRLKNGNKFAYMEHFHYLYTQICI